MRTCKISPILSRGVFLLPLLCFLSKVSKDISFLMDDYLNDLKEEKKNRNRWKKFKWLSIDMHVIFNIKKQLF